MVLTTLHCLLIVQQVFFELDSLHSRVTVNIGIQEADMFQLGMLMVWLTTNNRRGTDIYASHTSALF